MTMQPKDYTRAAATALEAAERMKNLNGVDLIETACAYLIGTQADLARHSGMTANTITALKQGKRATQAQRAALAWAIFKRWA